MQLFLFLFFSFLKNEFLFFQIAEINIYYRNLTSFEDYKLVKGVIFEK